MIKSIRKQSGMNLIELLFAMAVAAAIIATGMRQYRVYSEQGDLETVKRNAAQLLVAASNYYKAYCGNETYFPSTASTIPIDIQQKLITPGFLSSWVPQNPLVKKDGYSVQFKKSTNSYNVTSCWNFTYVDGTKTCSLPEPLINNPNAVILWVVQVAIEVTDHEKTKQYAYMIGADCTSDSSTQCNPGEDKPTYMIWQRLPSFASPDMESILTPSMTLLKQFKLQYTHDLMYELQTIPTNYVGSQYYLCGG